MVKTTQKMDMSELIMNRIKDENIQMKPRYYFMLSSWLLKGGFALAFLASIFFINLVIFKFRIYDPFGFLELGKLGLIGFFESVPWVFILVFTLTIALAIRLIKNFDISYKRSYPALSFAMVILLFVSGATLDTTGINHKLKQSGKIDLFYHGQYATSNLRMGEVESVNNTNKTMVLSIPFSQRKVHLSWTNNTVFAKRNDIKVGDYIQAVGNKKDKTFVATGIRFRN